MDPINELNHQPFTPEQKEMEDAITPAFKRLRAEVRAAMRDPDMNRRYMKITQVADAAFKAVQPFTPCRDGCSACCYQAVLVTDQEAEIIERYTGIEREPQRPIDVAQLLDEAIRMVREVEANQRRYFKVPCSFLRGTRCSIYEVRPMACRTHHILGDTAAPCSAGWNADISKVNTSFVDSAYIESSILQPAADIRQWFPNVQNGEKGKL